MLGQSYNNWLRSTAKELPLTMLKDIQVNWQEARSVLESQRLPETTMARSEIYRTIMDLAEVTQRLHRLVTTKTEEM